MPISHSTRSPQDWRHQPKRIPVTRSWKPDAPSAPSVGSRFNDTLRHPRHSNFTPKNWFTLLMFGALVLIVLLFASYLFLSAGLPDPNKLIDRQIAQSTKIYDRTGTTLLYEISGDQKRTLISLNDIPDYVKQATVAIEDKDFYKHGGFSVWAMFRTLVTDVLFRKSAGGSTLTQQLVKNAILTNEKTITRKLKELILAYRIEKKFSKDEILQMYLNEIPYGSNAYGVETASQIYFGKPASKLNLAEAAILAALPQSPTRYSPFGDHQDLLFARQKYILDLMVKQGYINADQAAVAKQVKFTFKSRVDNIIAPHFVTYIKELLVDKYGQTEVEQGGLKIYTTLDLYKQKVAEDTIKELMPNNLKKYDAGNAALVSINPKTGEVLAMVGSKDFFDETIDGQVNVALKPRQPGSSFKPIVYTTAFTKGYTPNTKLYDVVTNFSTDPSKPYEPHNYDNKEHGIVTMRQALAGSLNIPAVKTMYLAGINKVQEMAKNLGYTTLDDKDRFGLSLVLGGGEVTLLEHTNAYSAFANDGQVNTPMFILKIVDKDGKTLEENKPLPPRQVFDANIARETTSILTDNGARAYIFGARNYLTLPDRPVGAKTGTTNDYHDAWTIGFTPSLVSGVWVGNSDNAAMKRGSDGSILAAPIWQAYMKKVLAGTPVEAFSPPVIPITGKAILDGGDFNVTKVKIDKSTGFLATNQTPANLIEEKSYSKENHCILYYVNKDDPTGPAPTNPADDPQFNLWESRVQAWAAKQGFNTSTPPTESDNVHTAANQPTIDSISFNDNDVLTAARLTISLTVTAPRGVNRVDYFIDNNLFYSNNVSPFGVDKPLNILNAGAHTLKVRVCDDVDNCTEQVFNFKLTVSGVRQTDNLAISWAAPAANQSFGADKFPLALKFNLINVDNTAKVIIHYQGADKKDMALITLTQPNSTLITTTWPTAPQLGDYTLYAEAVSWQNKVFKSKLLKITIK